MMTAASRRRLAVAATAASALALLTGCSTGPSDADRAAWSAWSASVIGANPGAAASGMLAASEGPGTSVTLSTGTTYRAVELRCIGADRVAFALTYTAGSSTVSTQQDIVCQQGALRTPIAIPTAMHNLTSFTVSATSSDGEGMWTAQVQR